MRKIFFTLGSSRVRLTIGLVLAGLLMAQIIAAHDTSQVSTAIADDALGRIDPNASIQTAEEGEGEKLQRWAQNDHVALLEHCLIRYKASVKDYTCILTKQERLDDKMGGEQVIDIKFKEDPFSVLMTWRSGATRGDKILYVESADQASGGGEMLIHPTGFAGRLFKSVSRKPRDPEVMQSSLRSVDEFGFARGLQSLIDVYKQAIAAGHLKAKDMTYEGTVDFNGRTCFVIERVLPPGHDYPANLTRIYIDQEYLVPVMVYGTDWQGNDLCLYKYTDLKFNVGLDQAEFSRSSNGL